MARYYGSTQGGKGEAHRLGGKASGIRTLAATWGQGVEVTIEPQPGEVGKDAGNDTVTIRLVPHGYSAMLPLTVFRGNWFDLATLGRTSHT
jgi:hypothetical protein